MGVYGPACEFRTRMPTAEKSFGHRLDLGAAARFCGRGVGQETTSDLYSQTYQTIHWIEERAHPWGA